MRAYTAAALLALLDAAGFAGARCLGDLDGGEFRGAERRLVVAATR